MLVITMLILLNDVYIDIRLREMRSNLLRIDRNEKNIDHISLVTKYNIHEKLFLKKISIENADSIEFTINQISSKKIKSDTQKMINFQCISVPALWLINASRYFMDKPPIGTTEEGAETSRILDLAYFYENNNYFKKAAETYNLALEKGNFDKTMTASILLHQGYCMALLGKHTEARKYYLNVINNYPTEDVSITAVILLRYLTTFQKEYANLKNRNLDAVLKSEKLYELMAFREALNILESIESEKKDNQPGKIQYYKARCYNALGQSEKSVNHYIELILNSPESYYSKLSKRRLYIIGSRLGGDNKIKKIAVQLNRTYRDSAMDNMILNDTLSDEESNAANIIKGIRIKNSYLSRIKNLGNIKKNQSLKGRKIIIHTRDESKFIGIVVAETNTYFKLSTSIGEVKIIKNRIKKIEIK